MLVLGHQNKLQLHTSCVQMELILLTMKPFEEAKLSPSSKDVFANKVFITRKWSTPPNHSLHFPRLDMKAQNLTINK